MSKKTFSSAPKPRQLTADDIDAYVKGGAGHDTGSNAQATTAANTKAQAGPTKRLSLDLPEETHRRFKVACAATGRKMVTELTALIEIRIDELESETKN